MDQGVGLIMLSGVMLVGSFLAGSIPIAMHLSEDKVHFTSVVGAGLLVGTALSVIIPEGIHTLVLASSSGVLLPAVAPTAGSSGPRSGVIPPLLGSPGPGAAAPSKSSLVVVAHDDDHHSHSHSHSRDGSNSNPSDAFGSIGLALVLGFLFMLLIDQCSRSKSVGRDAESGLSPHGGKRSFTATLGLVVHAAADGIALGAAATTSHTDVEMIVFFAIMLHKAPAAFGLVTFLLHEGLDRKRIRKHLAIFSLAAPIAAIVTYFGISPEGRENASTMHATAFAMLFSAGTFLYVATVHVLPEVTKDAAQGYSRKELLALVIGTVLPLFLTAGHKH